MNQSSRKLSKALATAALGGMLVGSAGFVTGCQDKAGTKATTPAGVQHACKGQNACKGQGGCKTADHACKGQNACKGQGGCNA